MVPLCRLLVPLLQSPLAAPQASKTLVRLGEVSFEDFGQALLGKTTK